MFFKCEIFHTGETVQFGGNAEKYTKICKMQGRICVCKLEYIQKHFEEKSVSKAKKFWEQISEIDMKE